MAKLFEVGQIVECTTPSDNTMQPHDDAGIITSLNTNGLTGNTAEDPLYVVVFPDGCCSSYWKEELKLCTDRR